MRRQSLILPLIAGSAGAASPTAHQARTHPHKAEARTRIARNSQRRPLCRVAAKVLTPGNGLPLGILCGDLERRVDLGDSVVLVRTGRASLEDGIAEAVAAGAATLVVST